MVKLFRRLSSKCHDFKVTQVLLPMEFAASSTDCFELVAFVAKLKTVS